MVMVFVAGAVAVVLCVVVLVSRGRKAEAFWEVAAPFVIAVLMGLLLCSVAFGEWYLTRLGS